MSSEVILQHATLYRYDRPVHLGPQIVRLCPRPDSAPQVSDFQLQVSPAAHQLAFETDAHGNRVACVRFDTPVSEFRIDVSLVLDPGAPAATEAASSDPVLPAYREPVGPNPAMASWLAQLLSEDAAAHEPQAPLHASSLLPMPMRLCAAVAQRLAYTVRHEPGVQMPDETLALGSGSCRDSAWLLIAMLRSAGWAARFVSGYLVQTGQAAGPDHDSSDQSPADTGLHAWCEVHLPGHGWVGLDATSGQTAGPGHVALACAAMPWQAAPVEGSVERCHVDFSHSISVRLRGQP